MPQGVVQIAFAESAEQLAHRRFLPAHDLFGEPRRPLQRFADEFRSRGRQGTQPHEASQPEQGFAGAEHGFANGLADRPRLLWSGRLVGGNVLISLSEGLVRVLRGNLQRDPVNLVRQLRRHRQRLPHIPAALAHVEQRGEVERLCRREAQHAAIRQEHQAAIPHQTARLVVQQARYQLGIDGNEDVVVRRAQANRTTVSYRRRHAPRHGLHAEREVYGGRIEADEKPVGDPIESRQRRQATEQFKEGRRIVRRQQ